MVSDERPTLATPPSLTRKTLAILSRHDVLALVRLGAAAHHAPVLLLLLIEPADLADGAPGRLEPQPHRQRSLGHGRANALLHVPLGFLAIARAQQLAVGRLQIAVLVQRRRTRAHRASREWRRRAAAAPACDECSGCDY